MYIQGSHSCDEAKFKGFSRAFTKGHNQNPRFIFYLKKGNFFFPFFLFFYYFCFQGKMGKFKGNNCFSRVFKRLLDQDLNPKVFQGIKGEWEPWACLDNQSTKSWLNLKKIPLKFPWLNIILWFISSWPF